MVSAQQEVDINAACITARQHLAEFLETELGIRSAEVDPRISGFLSKRFDFSLSNGSNEVGGIQLHVNRNGEYAQLDIFVATQTGQLDPRRRNELNAIARIVTDQLKRQIQINLQILQLGNTKDKITIAGEKAQRELQIILQKKFKLISEVMPEIKQGAIIHSYIFQLQKNKKVVAEIQLRAGYISSFKKILIILVNLPQPLDDTTRNQIMGIGLGIGVELNTNIPVEIMLMQQYQVF